MSEENRKRSVEESDSTSASSSSSGSESKKARVGERWKTPAALFDLLAHTRVTDKQLWATEENVIYTASRTDKIAAVFKGLLKFNILSVPVLQKTKGRYYGFVDMVDVVNFMLEHFSSKVTHVDHFWEEVQKIEEYREASVKEVMTYPLTRRNPFHPVGQEYSLLFALELLAREPSLHRVPILNNNEERRLMNIITQSQVIEFLWTHRGLMGDRANQPVAEMANVEKHVWQVTLGSSAQLAFQMMRKHSISGVAVVNDEGKLVDNVSLRDIKAVSNDGKLFHRLRLPVEKYLQAVKKGHQDMYNRPRKAVFITNDTTLVDCVGILRENRLHHVYLVDEEHKPIGVCSMKDILFELLH